MAVRSKIPSILQKMNGALRNQSNGLAAPSFRAFTQAMKDEGMIVRGNTMNVMRPFPTQDSFLARRGITVGAGLASYPIDAVHRRMMTTSAQAIKHRSSLGAKPLLNGVAGPVNAGFRDILADYVHHPMTRTLMLVYFRVFLLVVTKDVFLSVFP